MPIYAKREGENLQTLGEHTREALLILKQLINYPSFKAFCRRWGLNPKELTCSAFLVVALHDLGKATEQFQECIIKGKHATWFPHPIFSLPLFWEIWKQGKFSSLLDLKLNGSPFPILESLTILAHHQQLSGRIYEGLLQYNPRPRYLFQELCHLISELQDWHFKLGFKDLFSFSLIALKEDLIDNWNRKPASRILEVVKYMRDNKDWTKEKIKLKATYCFLLSLLKNSDLWASRKFSASCRGKDLIFPCLPNDSESKLISGKRLYHFQEELQKNAEPYVILFAPCGRGKTEGALLWFLSLRESYPVDRLILAMPTQITSNVMRERLAQIFGEENVGLYHGRSSLEYRELYQLKVGEILQETGDPEFWQEKEFIWMENFAGEVFSKPITVTTVDHLLYSFLHGFPQADDALGNLQTAAIVFDEVHYYDRLMLSNLRETFSLLREMKIPHLLMSGTLPQPLLEELRTSQYEAISDEEGANFRPFMLRKQNEPLVKTFEKRIEPNASFLRGVKNFHQAGKKQLIILNTVRKAQEVYKVLTKEIPQDQLILLHSRFTYAHRREKEGKMIKQFQEEGPFAIVATQVVEVSLDISGERLYTELAPIDALGQRGGRLHRGAKEPDNYELILFPVDDPKPYVKVEPLLSQTQVLLREGELSYGEIKSLCEKIYSSYSLGLSQLRKLFDECTLFGWAVEDIRYNEEEGKLFHTREVTYPTIDVIPQSLVDELGEEAFDPVNLAPVPIWWLGKSLKENLGIFYGKEKGGLKYLVCQIPYDRDLGFEETKIGEPPPGVIID